MSGSVEYLQYMQIICSCISLNRPWLSIFTVFLVNSNPTFERKPENSIGESLQFLAECWRTLPSYDQMSGDIIGLEYGRPTIRSLRLNHNPCDLQQFSDFLNEESMKPWWLGCRMSELVKGDVVQSLSADRFIDLESISANLRSSVISIQP